MYHQCKFARPPGSATVSERAPSWPAGSPRAGRDHADVAQLVEHHLAKVRVAGSNPVVRSEASDAVSRCRWPARLPVTLVWVLGSGRGGVAEWPRQGPAKPCTRVRFPPPPRGRLAQWES